MKPHSPARSSAAAMLGSAAVVAHIVAGKATRDALFLGHLGIAALPSMVIAASIVSIAVAVAASKGAATFSPSRVVPAAFLVSAGLLIIEWLMLSRAATIAIVLVYLHVSCIAPALGSGFWLVATERFDPHTARRHVGRIGAAGTAGGLLGGLLAERVGATLGVGAMLPTLAAINLVATGAMTALGGAAARDDARRAAGSPPAPARSGLRIVAETPYLRTLAAFVAAGAMSATLADYVFKLEAARTFGDGAQLLRFFAVFYAAMSAIVFALQASIVGLALERLGLAATASAPSWALTTTGVVWLAAPGLIGATMARGAEWVSRGSLFRAAYELFYTPVEPAEKRAAKTIVDVGFDRIGDGVGAGVARLVIVLTPLAASRAIVSLAVAGSIFAALVARRLDRGYIQLLERRLIDRAIDLDLSDVHDRTTRATILETLGARRDSQAATSEIPPLAAAEDFDQLALLRSRDPERVRRLLRADTGLSAALVPHVIRLLRVDAIAEDAVFALRKVAEERVGELIDALVDPNEDFAVRRRLARVLAVCVSQRAADGLMLGLEDLRFEVRFRCAGALAAVLEKNPHVRVDRERIFQIVVREAGVGASVWNERRLIDPLAPASGATHSLSHVFTLLSIVLPRDPLHAAWKGLTGTDPHTRGTALEYLNGVLPPEVRARLWPMIGRAGTAL